MTSKFHSKSDTFERLVKTKIKVLEDKIELIRGTGEKKSDETIKSLNNLKTEIDLINTHIKTFELKLVKIDDLKKLQSDIEKVLKNIDGKVRNVAKVDDVKKVQTEVLKNLKIIESKIQKEDEEIKKLETKLESDSEPPKQDKIADKP